MICTTRTRLLPESATAKLSVLPNAFGANSTAVGLFTLALSILPSCRPLLQPVCVCVWERESVIGSDRVSEGGGVREGKRERESEKEREREREREKRERERERAHACARSRRPLR